MLLVLLSADRVAAQYNVGGGPSGAPTIPTRETFDEAIKNAPWRLGGLHVQPWAGLRDASLVSNQDIEGSTGDDDTDFTLTVGAGARLYAGKRKSIFTAQALPEYVWWNEATDRRQLNGRYGVGYFGYFNRLHVELSSRLSQQQSFFSEELRQLTTTRVLNTQAIAELALSRRFELYVFGALDEFSGEDEDRPIFSLLDRDTETFGLGVRYEAPEGLAAELGYLQGSAEFAPGALDYSNDFEEIRVGAGYSVEKFGSRFEISRLEVTPVAGSTLPAFEDELGAAELRWSPSRRVDLGLFAHRRFRYALASSYTTERRGVRVQLHSRIAELGIAASVGEDDFAAIGRVDDVEELEALLDFELGQWLIVTVSASYVDYRSNVPGATRDVTRLGVAVQLGEIADRLRLGSDRGAW